VFISIAVFMIVIVAHELAHGYVAYLLGDTTAKNAGRLTLNPLAHADMMGTIVLPALLIITRSPVIFGWAKPVPINPGNFKNPRQGILLTSLAGPAANFILAFIFAILFKTGAFAPHSVLWTFLLYGIIISLVLGLFNLLPVPPLDGANIVASILPRAAAIRFMKIEPYGFVILIGLLYLGLFGRVILPIARGLMYMLVN